MLTTAAAEKKENLPLLQAGSSGINNPKPTKSLPFMPIRCVPMADQHSKNFRQAEWELHAKHAQEAYIWPCPAGYTAPSYISVEI